MKASLSDPEIERAARAVTGARIAIMNPPFTNRQKMGESSLARLSGSYATEPMTSNSDWRQPIRTWRNYSTRTRWRHSL